MTTPFLFDTACMRCHRVGIPLGEQGHLRLCTACAAGGPAPTCPEGAHAWRGHEAGWLCFTCGEVLPSSPIEAEGAATPAPRYDYDC